MPPHLWDPIAPPVRDLVTPVAVDPAGVAGPTRGRAQGPHWRTTSPGRFVPAASADELVEQRILEAYHRTGGRAVVSAWAGLRLLGGGFFDGLGPDGRRRLPIPLAANGERFGAHPELQRLRFTVPDDEVVVVHGMRCAVAERALFDQMRLHHDVREMAVAAGCAFAGELTSITRMRRYLATRRWYRDVRLAREAIEMSVEEARSPHEDRFRLIWEYDARWDRPLINRPLLDLDGRLIAIPDLFCPERGVVGEFAGAGHRDGAQHRSDVAREAAIRGAGLEYVEVVGRDLREPRTVITRMEQARARAGLLTQRWQLGPPRSPTLDQILDARDAARAE